MYAPVARPVMVSGIAYIANMFGTTSASIQSTGCGVVIDPPLG